jgi:hypothetical protein
MLNPYTLLTPPVLQAMLRQPMYFVRQYFERGKFIYDTNETIPLLFTHYPCREEDRERAERHTRLLFKDPYRKLYDSRIPEHYEKLLQASQQPEGYRIYINLMVSKWKAGDGLKSRIAVYLQHRLPWWKYSPADKLKVTLKERYGELYLGLLWKGQQTEVNLTEIENFSVCAMT